MHSRYGSLLTGWPGRYIMISVMMTVNGVPATENTLKQFVERKEFLPSSGFLSRRDMT